MIIVLDSSVGIEIVLSREKSKKFISLIKQAKKVISSDLYKIEIANVLWKYAKAGLLQPHETNELLYLAQELVDEYKDISEYNEEAMREAIRLNHSAYDMLYFTLARRLGATLLTLDKQLSALCMESSVSIIDS